MQRNVRNTIKTTGTGHEKTMNHQQIMEINAWEKLKFRFDVILFSENPKKKLMVL